MILVTIMVWDLLLVPLTSPTFPRTRFIDRTRFVFCFWFLFFYNFILFYFYFLFRIFLLSLFLTCQILYFMFRTFLTVLPILLPG